MNRNSQGNTTIIVLVVLLLLFISSMSVLFVNREKISQYFKNLLPEDRNIVKIQSKNKDEINADEIKTDVNQQRSLPNNNTKTTEYTKKEMLERNEYYQNLFEELDNEFFSLFTLEKLTDSNPQNVKNTLKRIREINEKYQENIINVFGSNASMCANSKNVEYELRQVEQIYVIKKPSIYQKEVFLDNFEGKRIFIERNYQQFCKLFYSKIGAKLYEQ